MGLLLPACLPVSYPPEPVPASQARPIVQGTDAPGDAAAVALVARRTRCGGEPPVLLCSGALIAPDVVLTAAHCLSVFGAEGPYEVFLGPTLLPEPAAGGRFVRVTRAVAHPAHVPATHAYDAALLRLATPVNGLPPFRLPEATGTPVAVGSSVRAVGYGDTKDAARPPGQRRQGQLQVTGVAPASFQAGPAPGMSCVGDSGGPVLGTPEGDPGTEVLWGLTVSGDVACRSEAVQVRVDALEDFLRPFLEAGPPPAGPAPLALDALCQEACATDAECPAGLLCVAAGDAPARCLLPALQAGTFGAACSEDAACGAQGVCARLEVEGDAACRCFTPCEAAVDPPTPGDGPPDSGGGCAQAPGALGGMGGVLLGLLRRQSRPRTSRCRSRDDSA
ncbi:S1 family peptidase [Corallococcus sicarius]|uniref:S1 family peptidase n=1 Tax=Corallococcus sicarius TaxID=2316726 RepID=UPI001FC9A5CC|nr:trypsin-like serine protease [Corallococcus sicarius]